MDWARDHLGNHVPASRGGMSGFGLVCPCCREPVRRRAGIERRPHFAHYSHRAKPNCENYFPPGLSAGTSDARPVTANEPPRFARDSLSCGILLAYEPDHDSLGLWLRVPSMAVAADCALEIQSGLGHRVYRGPDLRIPRLVPLVPQVPLAGCVGSGELTALAAHVSSQVAAFDPRLNFFHAEQGGGRFVFPDEPLEWGGRCRCAPCRWCRSWRAAGFRWVKRRATHW